MTAIPLSPFDKQLLTLLQREFPLVPRPFATLAARMAVDEAEVLKRTRQLKRDKVIRQISAIFDSRRLGYRSTLVAFRVPEERLNVVAAQISAHPGVSHNYARNHDYNLWFTLTLPPDQAIDAHVSALARRTDVASYLNLPAVRLFKIGVQFDLAEESSDAGRQVLVAEEAASLAGSQSVFDRSQIAPAGFVIQRPGGGFAIRREQKGDLPVFSDSDRAVVRELQEDIELVPRPFAPMARRLGMSEEALLVKARGFLASGVMRRYGAVLRHRRAGFAANGMVCWVVPKSRIEEVGRLAATYPQVSHCYQRPPRPPDWPYTLFTMVHGRIRAEVEAVAENIAAASGSGDYVILYSLKEYKKERVKYF
ncbi:MAG TPA: Lrp/AsnC family transcriptional regulator [Anaerolineae bacterium]|nr:Lrp/AsnC family transcriptional regulator [Anaerolineae bacterium]